MKKTDRAVSFQQKIETVEAITELFAGSQVVAIRKGSGRELTTDC
jgi:hypothetical protein